MVLQALHSEPVPAAFLPSTPENETEEGDDNHERDQKEHSNDDPDHSDIPMSPLSRFQEGERTLLPLLACGESQGQRDRLASPLPQFGTVLAIAHADCVDRDLAC